MASLPLFEHTRKLAVGERLEQDVVEETGSAILVEFGVGRHREDRQPREAGISSIPTTRFQLAINVSFICSTSLKGRLQKPIIFA